MYICQDIIKKIWIGQDFFRDELNELFTRVNKGKFSFLSRNPECWENLIASVYFGPR